ncbi:hypothetical protein GCM10010329_66810 [Streptomyces spiroverticillatus]|uniref:DUF2786 domain-containing protein n=1 Tax=Streptomyces finlayi TaxID=67296 RepID=A0A918X4Q4_9ACTN|nr:DUF2786 domain-containing protein [Streptomyces finlayi]GHA34272.1 hypothetical protein GCM10010329_66810 [Streptomyces spiroverticillatus]GHD11847.1 hypothetical protein GCM10010334_68360 [Streptomyces finlayi]
MTEEAFVGADQAFSALYGTGDDDLDLGASLLAAAPWPDAGREVLRRGEEFVRRAWDRGWQPADVARLVRRDLDDVHVRLLGDLIAAELRRHPEEQLPPRWRAQVGELGADAVWWKRDEAYGDALARREKADRFSLATAALELLRLLIRLPSIEPVGPAPGAGARVRQAQASPDEPRMLTRIRALLAKAEATDYPEEAEALTGKAQELMARHSIDEAVLAAQGATATGPGACRIGVDAPYETAKAILLDAVATANRCRAVWNSAFGFSTVVGFEADLDAVELLYTSLLVQGTAAMTRAEAAQRAGGRKRTKSFRQSFLTAYASRLGTRLAEATEHVVEETAGALLPVLAARDVAVTDRAEQMFPRTTSTRVRGVNDLAGWEHGTAAADRASVPGRQTPQRGRIRS